MQTNVLLPALPRRPNEFDLVLFFNDPASEERAEDISYISRLCDQNRVPFASNIATAEMLVRRNKEDLKIFRNLQARLPPLRPGLSPDCQSEIKFSTAS